LLATCCKAARLVALFRLLSASFPVKSGRCLTAWGSGEKEINNDRRQFHPGAFCAALFAIFCSLAFLLGRVAWLQIIKPDNLVKQEDMRSLRQLAIDAPRGMITDREGRPLAVSVPVRAVWADPKTVLAKGALVLTIAGRRWRMRCISWAHSLRALTPTRRGGLFTLPVRLILRRQMDR
jgi:hypothetical protein